MKRCKEHKDLINRFLKYDYVGAPWCNKTKNSERVGNGGLSLRKKSKMLEIILNDTNTNRPEDVYFARSTMVPLYKPSVEEAKLFSIENVFSPISFGCHKPWNSTFFNALYEIYPEAYTLYKLNKLNKSGYNYLLI